jgi:hypothetical protein
MSATAWARAMEMMARETVAPMMMTMRCRAEGGGGGVCDAEDEEDDDGVTDGEEGSRSLWSRYAEGSQWSICTVSVLSSQSSWVMAVTRRRRRRDTPLSTAFSATAMVNS